MPTNSNAYNSRVTDEALEKRFRDTFTSQGGSELVSDLYASGVIVPVVDFTGAATGQQLAQNLQTAWDFSTGFTNTENTTNTLITTPGFWQIDVTWHIVSGTNNRAINIFIDAGVTTKTVWYAISPGNTANQYTNAGDDKFVVFLRSGDSLKCTSNNADAVISHWYRQIADVNGNLVDPFGFTSS